MRESNSHEPRCAPSKPRLLLTSFLIVWALFTIPILAMFHATVFRGMPIQELILGLVNWTICSVPLTGAVWLGRLLWRKARS